jgi:mRNA-degrading endonuclease YafQ of YafQ-DinJ toxin-antitoxin module
VEGGRAHGDSSAWDQDHKLKKSIEKDHELKKILSIIYILKIPLPSVDQDHELKNLQRANQDHELEKSATCGSRPRTKKIYY